MWLHFRRQVELELSVCNNFRHTYYQECRPSYVLFSHHTNFVHLLYLGKLSRPTVKIKQNHENFTSRWDFDLKSLSVKTVCCMKAAGWISRLGLETWKHRQSAKENPQDGYNCPATTHCSGRPRSALRVEDFVRSQEDKSKRHRSPREILCETAILCSSVHRIIHHNLQLKCFKQRRVQLLSEANHTSRRTRW